MIVDAAFGEREGEPAAPGKVDAPSAREEWTPPSASGRVDRLRRGRVDAAFGERVCEHLRVFACEL